MMGAERSDIQPIPVQIVEAVRAPNSVVGQPLTITPTAVPEPLLQTSKRRIRAFISIVGTGVVGFGNNPNTMIAGAGTRAQGALVQGPANFELQSTNEWWVYLVSGASTTVSVITETESDV